MEVSKTVLITGASAGIGRELAFEFASHGFDLILVARRIERLEQLSNDVREKFPVQVKVIGQDLGLTDSADKLFETVSLAGLSPGILINNAGFGLRGLFEDTEIITEEQMIVLNILTLTKLTKLFGRQMASNNGGTIINIASTAAFQPVPYFGVYAATKAYVMSFSRAVDFEWKKKNVRVLTICPGPTETEFGSVAGVDVKTTAISGSVPDGKDLARFIYASLHSGKSLAIHGFMNRIQVFLQRFVPGNIIVRTAAMLMKP
jgi:short-subunit dehydrogenase